ncbi:hypothetical protein CO046_02570 [Candidatus Peregrinibacteria bacterium CG_4_9_14_0_2_um_filter_53_11]|nr:MAG: hypothetical protein CO046_02570 [Candidatus Peregrinibacteria bacterium CG_4_9_14_0_2_um_filter_53_11]
MRKTLWLLLITPLVLAGCSKEPSLLTIPEGETGPEKDAAAALAEEPTTPATQGSTISEPTENPTVLHEKYTELNKNAPAERWTITLDGGLQKLTVTTQDPQNPDGAWKTIKEDQIYLSDPSEAQRSNDFCPWTG